MQISDIQSYNTGNSGINWLLSKATFSDFSDDNGVYFVGEFKGSISNRFMSAIRDYFEHVTGEQFRKSHLLINEENRTLEISVTFPQYKGDSKISFYVSYVAENV